ncbi:MAG: hypothetical protein JW709_02160 [Sedimentisphaerales bacterium]|nr:hypothetical protein [Sedimentisphaerales bacterium]
MARKKVKKVKKDRPKFWQRLKEGLEPEQWVWLRRRGIQVAVMLMVIVGGAAGMKYLQTYVKSVTARREIPLRLTCEHIPWATQEHIQQILLSSGVKNTDNLLDETLVSQWAENLQANPWIRRVRKVHKHYDGLIEFDLELREPVAMVEDHSGRYMVDAEGIVLPMVRLADGHVVRLTGQVEALPQPGQAITSSALLAGLEVLTYIKSYDDRLPASDQLWRELAMLDVSNYNGRRYADQTHLKFYTCGNTELRWGAALGKEIALYEAPPERKLETLYRKHSIYGTFDKFMSVELCELRPEVADPLRRG